MTFMYFLKKVNKISIYIYIYICVCGIIIGLLTFIKKNIT